MGTKNNPGRWDCYAKAAPDEPIFVLRANDPIAPGVVRLWAAQYWQNGGNPEKIAEARACADAMEAWHKQHLARSENGRNIKPGAYWVRRRDGDPNSFLALYWLTPQRAMGWSVFGTEDYYPTDAFVVVESVKAPITATSSPDARVGLMDTAGIPALIDAIRHLHDCGATHVETVHVHEKASTGETVWDGDVEVFDLIGHAGANRAYAWSEATMGKKRRFFAVLHAPGIDTPAHAVQASLLTDAVQKR